MKIYWCLMVFLLSFFGFSQNVSLTGKLADEQGVPLGSATVYLEKVSDSSMISYTISDPDGAFRLKGYLRVCLV